MVFEKVYNTDIKRLLNTEHNWKRKPPKALDFDEISKDAARVCPSVSLQDQRKWTLLETYVVFVDR